MENSRPRNKKAENNDFVGDSGNNPSLESSTSAATSSRTTNHFSIAEDLQKLLDNSKESSQATSFVGGSLKANNISSIINDKTSSSQHNSQENNETFRSREKVAFDSEFSGKNNTKDFFKDLKSEFIYSEANNDNVNLKSFNNNDDKVATILPSDFPLEDSRNPLFSSEAQNNITSKYSQPINEFNYMRVNRGVTNTAEYHFDKTMDTNSYICDGEDVLRLLDNPSGDEFYEDLYSDPEFAAKELREFEEFIKLKYNCLPENVILDSDIIDYVDSPDYLEDVYGLPELYEYLKKPKSTGVSIHKIKALERLTLIKAHLEKSHL